MHLRDGRTGREYLLMRSQIRREVARTDSTTTSTLADGVGEYALVRAASEGPSPAPQLRVDCPSSRVLPAERPGT